MRWHLDWLANLHILFTLNCVVAFRLAMAKCKPKARINISLDCVTNSHFIGWHVFVLTSCNPSSPAVCIRSSEDAVNADM